MAVFWKTNRIVRKSNQLSRTCRNNRSSAKTLIEIEKKCVLLEDEASDWLQIWTAAYSLTIQGNKAIKKNFVLANRLVFRRRSRI